MSISTKILANGVAVPCILFGSFQVKDAAQFEAVLTEAVSCGAFGFDTSPSYQTEAMLGDAVANYLRTHGDAKRENFFIQTKIDAWQMIAGKGDVSSHVKFALRKLKVDYIDAVLIHWPQPDYLIETWQCLESLYRDGIVRAIGVCNCYKRQLEHLRMAGASIDPMIVQNEIHPLNTEKDFLEFVSEKDVLIESYSPLGRMLPQIAQSSVLLELAERYNKSVAQVILRWHLEKGLVPIVKTNKVQRVEENLSALTFSLSADDVLQIDALNERIKIFLDSRCCPGC